MYIIVADAGHEIEPSARMRFLRSPRRRSASKTSPKSGRRTGLINADRQVSASLNPSVLGQTPEISPDFLSYWSTLGVCCQVGLPAGLSNDGWMIDQVGQRFIVV